jgi:hypothetical protein
VEFISEHQPCLGHQPQEVDIFGMALLLPVNLLVTISAQRDAVAQFPTGFGVRRERENVMRFDSARRKTDAAETTVAGKNLLAPKSTIETHAAILPALPEIVIVALVERVPAVR